MTHPLPASLKSTRTREGFDRFLATHVYSDIHDQARSLRVRIQNCRNLATQAEQGLDLRMAEIWDGNALALEDELARLLSANLLPEDVPEIPPRPSAICPSLTAEIEASRQHTSQQNWYQRQIDKLRALTYLPPQENASC